MREIICQNEDGMEVIFGNSFSPFLLENCEGIYAVNNDVTLSDNAMTDGAVYLGSTMKKRNIVLTLRDKPGSDHMGNRALLYSLFKPRSIGVFVYSEDGERKRIRYYVESVVIEGVCRARQATVSLLCPDPYFEAPGEVSLVLAGWVPRWEFPHKFITGGEAFGTRTQEKLKTIENGSAAEDTGLTIMITANGSVANPSITHVEKEETIKIGTAAAPLLLALGDQVVITTDTGNKHVYLIRAGGAKVEANEYLDEDSEFIQLSSGRNTLGYSADSGEEYMSVEISYRYRYLGV